MPPEGMNSKLRLTKESLPRQSCRTARPRLNVRNFGRLTPCRRHTRAPRCSKEPQKDLAQPKSYREKLKSNPAYQRLKQGTWQHQYKPSEPDSEPGPIPEHLLGENGASGSRRVPGSITQHIQDAAEPPKAAEESQQHASTSGRQDQPSQPSSLAPALSSSQMSGTRISRVRFWLQFHAQFGQRMRIVGSHESLGSWLLSRGGELEWSAGDKWSTVIDIPAGAIVEYKYVLCEGDGLTAIAWQQGNNNVMAVGHADDNLEVFDTWESGPGAAIIAAGEQTTREGRMLSWANEVESLFASQRNELRQSRMELLAAQDEARIAREEARQFRADLRSSQAELTQAQMKVRELTVSNKMLKTQLDETNHSFRHALETTHKFLLEAENALTAQTAGKKVGSQNDSDDEAGSPSTGKGRRKAAAKKPAVRKARKTKKEREEEGKQAASQEEEDKSGRRGSQLDIKAQEGSGRNSNGAVVPDATPTDVILGSNGTQPMLQEQPVQQA